MVDMKSLGEAIRQFRKIKGLTQEELAKRSDLSTMSIRRYENGERLVSEKTLSRIADALSVPVDYLLGIQALPGRERVFDLGVERKTVVISSGAIETEAFDDFLTEIGFKTYIDPTRFRKYGDDSEKNKDDVWIIEDTREKMFYTATTEDLNHLMNSILSFSKFQIYELIHRLPSIDEKQIGCGRQDAPPSQLSPPEGTDTAAGKGPSKGN